MSLYHENKKRSTACSRKIPIHEQLKEIAWFWHPKNNQRHLNRCADILRTIHSWAPQYIDPWRSNPCLKPNWRSEVTRLDPVLYNRSRAVLRFETRAMGLYIAACQSSRGLLERLRNRYKHGISHRSRLCPCMHVGGQLKRDLQGVVQSDDASTKWFNDQLVPYAWLIATQFLMVFHKLYRNIHVVNVSNYDLKRHLI